MSDDGGGNATLALVFAVRSVLDAHGLDSAIIGAGALAIHGYVRATGDVDLAVVSDLATLRRVTSELIDADTAATFIEPDADDHLGGVVTIVRSGAKPVQLVNFVNERRARNRNPGLEAIRTRITSDTLAVVDLAHLVALKLWAGGPKSVSDVVGPLEANPGADLAAIDDVCARFELSEAWRPLRPTSR